LLQHFGAPLFQEWPSSSSTTVVALLVHPTTSMFRALVNKYSANTLRVVVKYHSSSNSAFSS